tara:strand:+ start:26922 stop:27053 length:132 start_codon:yes stop_codon:yes gene_type:complete
LKFVFEIHAEWAGKSILAFCVKYDAPNICDSTTQFMKFKRKKM